MSQAITLFLLAIKLLTLVNSTPNLPQPLRTQAISIANIAIAEANSQLAVSQVTPIITGNTTVQIQSPVTTVSQETPVQPIITQSNPTQKVMENETQAKITAIVVKTTPADVVNSVPFGSYIIQVRVMGADGTTTVNGASVVMASPNNLYGESVTKTIDTRETPKSTDFYTSFEYVPTTKGEKTITFTSGNLTKELDINVQ